MTDFIGWNSLTPNEQLAFISGGVGGLGFVGGLRVLFGGLALKRTKKKRKDKGRKKGRR